MDPAEESGQVAAAETSHHESLKTPTPQEEIIGTREKIGTGDLEGGANKVILVRLKDDGSGVFKPASGEVRLINGIEAGSYYKRERAAYLVSRFLGFDLVPPTVIREIGGDTGSIQEFIPDTKPAWEVDLSKYHHDELYKLWVFDLIIWSSDRHSGNLLVKGERLFAIDNGLSFGETHRFCYREFFGEKASEHVITLLKQVMEDKMRLGMLEEFLREVLSEYEARACVNRILKIGLELTKDGMIKKSISFDPD